VSRAPVTRCSIRTLLLLLLLLLLTVFVTRVDPNYAQPWQKCPQRSATGSAFVLDVEKHIIVTNAHVVRVSFCGSHGSQHAHSIAVVLVADMSSWYFDPPPSHLPRR
jgi:hypothetical protein